MKVLVTEPLAEEGVERLRQHVEVDVRVGLERDALMEILSDYDGVIVRSGTHIDAELIERADRLRVIGRAGTGVDNVDVDAATRQGVIVVNAPKSVSIANAEHTMALMLALARNVAQGDASLKAGRWEKDRFTGIELAGKTLGLIGLGRIGTLVAQRASAFGMRLLAVDPYISNQRFTQLGITPVSHEQLYREADFIVVLVPKTSETDKLIGERELALMKDGVRIINTARGGLIDEDALATALREGKVAGAALDVFEVEPPTDSKILSLPGVVATPHLGASTDEAQARAAVTIAEQVLLALQGEFAPYAVNVEAGTEFVEALRLFVPLTERLGRILTGLSGSGVSALHFEFHGNIAEHDTRILTLAGLKGAFGAIVHEPVTFVNAPLIASERGIEVKETKSQVSQDFVNLVVLNAETDEGLVSVGGTLVGKRDRERIVRAFEYEIDMEPQRFMCFLRYVDRPGIIGKVGTVLGEAGVNIAGMDVSRETIGGEALMGLTVDSQIPEKVLDQIVEAIEARDAKFIDLGP